MIKEIDITDINPFKRRIEYFINDETVAYLEYSLIYDRMEIDNVMVNEEHRGKGGGNPFAALHTSKSLSREERLELENLKLRIENERLKKGYIVKGVGANKEYVTTLDVNTKSSKS